MNLLNNSLSKLFVDVWHFNRIKLFCTLGLMFFKSVSSGVGLLLILPLLQIIGFSVGSNINNGIAKRFVAIFETLHLPLTLLSILACYILLISIIALAAYAEQCISVNLQERYIHYKRAQLYHHLLNSKWQFFIQQSASDLLHSLTGQVQTIGACNYQLLTLLNSGMLILSYTILAFMLSWPMTLLAIVCAVFLFQLMLPLHQKSAQSGQDHLQKNRAITQSIHEQLAALKMIKGSGAEAQFVDATLAVSRSLEKQNQRLTVATATTKLLYSVSSVVLFSMLLYVAISYVHLAIGSLLLLLIVFSRLLPMLSSLQQTYQRLLHQLPSFQEMQQLLQRCIMHQEAIQTGAISFNNAIVVRNLGFSYRPGMTPPILDNVSLQLKKNTITALVGPSGVGKSTLADLIIGLLEPTEGAIYIDNQLLNSTNKLAWRKQVAYLPQNAFLFNTSIRSNLTLFCQDVTDDRMWEVLNDASAANFVTSMDQGLDTIIGDRGVRLSNGECQRIALARALLSKPQLLVLDETTNALDEQNIIAIQHALTRLRDTMTIIIITHQTSMSNFADNIIHVKLPTRQIA